MNIFSRIKNAVVGCLGSKPGKTHNPNPGVTERRNGKLSFKTPPRFIRLRVTSGRGIFGPVFPARAGNHHASRQTCRAYLRDVFFAQFSKQYPSASRAQRRRVSRLAASAEYRRMMADPTNRISDNDAALAVTA